MKQIIFATLILSVLINVSACSKKNPDASNQTSVPTSTQDAKERAQFELTDYAMDITLQDTIPTELTVNQTIKPVIKVRNLSNKPWPNTGNYPVLLSYHLFTADGKTMLLRDGLRTSLPNEMTPPNTEVTVPISITTPKEPGVYLLKITMVQEHVFWLEDKGLKTIDRVITVK